MTTRVTRNGKHIIGDTTDAAFPGNAIVGKKDGVAVDAGFIGQKITGTAYATSLSNGARVKGADIPLTAGNWLVFMDIGASGSLTGNRTYVEIASDTSGTINYARADTVVVPTASAEVTFPLTAFITLAGSATIYGNVLCLFSGTGVATASNIYAIRIA